MNAFRLQYAFISSPEDNRTFILSRPLPTSNCLILEVGGKVPRMGQRAKGRRKKHA
nr:MAG TPA: hypothetical protein [Caudoviricetes sp.]